jgi:hypothetical protein
MRGLREQVERDDASTRSPPDERREIARGVAGSHETIAMRSVGPRAPHDVAAIPVRRVGDHQHPARDPGVREEA